MLAGTQTPARLWGMLHKVGKCKLHGRVHWLRHLSVACTNPHHHPSLRVRRRLLCALLQSTAALTAAAALLGDSGGLARGVAATRLGCAAHRIWRLLPAPGPGQSDDSSEAEAIDAADAAAGDEQLLASALSKLLPYLFGSDAAAAQQLLEWLLPHAPGQEPAGRLPADVAVVGARALACRTACAYVGCTQVLEERKPPRGSRCSGCRLLRFCSDECRIADWASRPIGIHRAACKALAAQRAAAAAGAPKETAA